MKRIAIIGELNLDLILTGISGLPEPGREHLASNMELVLGSSSAICAAQFARLGDEVVYLSVVGDDDFGRHALASLEGLGVPTRHVTVDPDLRTGLTVSIVTGADRAMLTYQGCISKMNYDRIDFEKLIGCDHLHVGAFFLQEGLQPDCGRIFERAKALGLTTSLDPGWDANGKWDGGLNEAIAHTDVFLPNETEAFRISRCAFMQEAAEALAEKGMLTVIKLGALGAVAVRDYTRIFLPGSIVNAVDTTGAGDSFDAGFLHGWLHGESLEKALELGLATGALSTRAAGGTGSQASLEEALSWASRATRRQNSVSWGTLQGD